MIALVTGATSGIGKEICYQLSTLGYDIIAVARNKEKLEEIKKYINTKYYPISLDLTKKDEVLSLYHLIQEKKLIVDLLVNNAGIGNYGTFDEGVVDEDIALLELNVIAVTILTKLFLKEMKARNAGTILQIASSAAFMPCGPFMSTYYASKKYVLSFSLAIHKELKKDKSAVKIAIFCPGPVNTSFNEKLGISHHMHAMSSKEAAYVAINKTLKGKYLIIPGIANKFLYRIQPFVPNILLNEVNYNIQKKKRKYHIT